MKERKKPSLSWIEKSKNEIAHEEELLAKRLELLNDIRLKKLLYQDSEAFKVGYEAGKQEVVNKLHELKCGYEIDLDAEPRVYERDIQLCAKISLIERLINELED